jgi:glycosyltransferase involved in cell wall biosynthesis
VENCSNENFSRLRRNTFKTVNVKLGIIGTRGIPNRHGGFEQFTEYIAPEFVRRGHEVFVYNSSLHPYEGQCWKGVNILRQTDPQNKIGTAGQFIYDLNCILDTRKRNFDVILQLGYTSSSVWTFLYPRNSALVTNMDGLEWKRAKYSKPVQFFLKQAERWAAMGSDALIADSRGIQEYLQKKYRKPSEFIAYGATLFNRPDESILKQFGLEKYNYDLVLARMEPENNIETIIKGHLLAGTNQILYIIGNRANKYGTYLKSIYEGPFVQFPGAIYDQEVLNNLRFFSRFYFHGHSVGGTNPSLLEAMASNAVIVANDNIFNRSVLENDALYFNSEGDIVSLLKQPQDKDQYRRFIESNRRKIETHYSWNHIVLLLENYLLKCFSLL